MNRSEKSKLKWFFPINEQLKALADERKKNKLESRSNLEYVNRTRKEKTNKNNINKLQ